MLDQVAQGLARTFRVYRVPGDLPVVRPWRRRERGSHRETLPAVYLFSGAGIVGGEEPSIKQCVVDIARFLLATLGRPFVDLPIDVDEATRIDDVVGSVKNSLLYQ